MIYNIYTKQLGYTPPVAKLLTRLTSFGDRLPQGSPASPSLCNLYFAPLVSELSILCASSGITFTQYIDDLTFSGEFTDLESAQEKIIKLVNKYGLRVNPRKLALKRKSERLVVTGYVVNNSNLTVGRKYLNRLKRDIMRVDDEAQATSINGKINYIGQVSRRKSLLLRRKLRTKVLSIKSSTDKK